MSAISETVVDVGGSPMRIHWAMPAAAAPRPGVLVLHHRGGLDTFTHSVLERLAGIGLVAAAPDCYHRRPAGEDFLVSIKTLRDSELVADMNAAVAQLQAAPGVDRARIGIVGHCLGGRTAYLGMGTNDAYRCAVLLYHGDLFAVRDDKLPAPIELTANIHVRAVAGFFGDRDPNPSPAAVTKLEDALRARGIPFEFHRYPQAGHAFQDYTEPSHYVESAANDAWAKLLDFLRRELQP